MKYGLMILRPDCTFDFFSKLSELHKKEDVEISYQYFQRQLKKNSCYELKNGSRVYRKVIQRAGKYNGRALTGAEFVPLPC